MQITAQAEITTRKDSTEIGHANIEEIGIADVEPLDDVVKFKLIAVLLPGTGQIPEFDFVTLSTVTVSVIVEPCWQPLIAPNVLP